MISRIIAFSINNKLTIGLLVVALIIAGFYSMQKVPVDAVPDITNNQVQVVTTSQSLAPQEVEQFITFPVEMAMANIPDVVKIRSISRFGLSVVTIVFEDHVPVLHARQYVKEQMAMAEAEIPAELGQPEMMPITTGLGEIYQYTLVVAPEKRNEYDAMALRTIQDWIVKRQLAGIKGIIEVSSFGGFVKQYEVAVDPNALRSLNVTITDVFNALEVNNQNSGGSYIEKGPYAYYIRTEGIVKSLSDIENIVVAQNSTTPVLIKHVAEVKFGFPPRFGAMTMDGKGETVGGITLMLKGANSSEAIKNVQNRVAEVQKSLPDGITIEPYLDRSTLVAKTIGTVRNNLIEGGLIVIFVLILLLGNFRAALIVASIIPLSLLFAFIMMNLIGVSANLMSLGAIDFGIVIDGAVIIVEGVLHYIYAKYIGKKLSQKEMDGVIKDRASTIFGSAAFGVLIILVVFIPIMTLTGIEGKMFRPMAQTVSFAILGALILSVTYVPMVASLFLNKNIKKSKSVSHKIISFMQSLYKPSLEFALRMPKTVIVLVIVLFAGIMGLFTTMGSEFIPTLEEGDLAMQMTLRPGSSLSASVRTTTTAEKFLLANFPEVRHVVSKIGTAEVPTDPMAVEEADIMIILKEKENWVSASSREDLIDQMKEKLSVIKSASFEFTQPIQLRFNELMTGAKTDVAIKIFGEDMEELHKQAVLAAAIVEKIPGAGDVKVEQTEGLPQIMVNYNRERMALYGLSIETMNQIIRSAYAGEMAGVVYEGERKFDLVVRLKDRKSLDLGQLFVTTVNGNLIPLSEVASMEIKEGPMQITREDAQRRISIGVNIRNRDVASFIADVQDALEGGLSLQPGYLIKYGGQFENLEAATKQLKIAVPISLLLIFVLLFFAFGSLRYAALIYSTVPLAAIGGVIALYTRGMPFSISAGVGFIALFGVAVLNGIVLITYFNQLKDRGIMDVKKLVVQGGLLRLRPVIMTAAVAALGFLPMALSSSAGAEVQKPLATVVIGGLITSTILTLIVLPVAYYLMEKRVKIRKDIVTGLLLLIGLGSYNPVNAQELTLAAAIDSAAKNNPLVMTSSFRVEQAEHQRKGAVSLGKTNLNYAYGQLNSPINDTYWGVEQEFGNPLAQVNRSKESRILIERENQLVKRTKLQIRRDVKLIWYQLLYDQKVVQLYDQHAAIIEHYYTNAELRYQLGELTASVFGLIEIEKSEFYHNFSQAKIAMAETQRRLKTITMINRDTLIVADSLKVLPIPNHQTSVADQVLLAYDSANSSLRASQVASAKAQYFPSFRVGYFNQTIDGVSGNQGVRAGLSIPLWFVPQKNVVDQAKIEEKIAQTYYQASQLSLDVAFSNTRERLDEYYQLYVNQDKNWQRQTRVLRSNVEQELMSGAIDYFRFVQIYAKALQIQLRRLELINSLNQTIIEFEYLSN